MHSKSQALLLIVSCQVVLIQVAVPSREDVEEYRLLKSEVDELVGRINSKYGAPQYQFNYTSSSTSVVAYPLSHQAHWVIILFSMSIIALTSMSFALCIK